MNKLDSYSCCSEALLKDYAYMYRNSKVPNPQQSPESTIMQQLNFDDVSYLVAVHQRNECFALRF